MPGFSVLPCFHVQAHHSPKLKLSPTVPVEMTVKHSVFLRDGNSLATLLGNLELEVSPFIATGPVL